MSTHLVVADLHFGFPFSGDDSYARSYLLEVIEKEKPDEITLLGDTVHFDHDDQDNEVQRKRLEQLLADYDIFSTLRDIDSIKTIRFVVGEEDWYLQKPILRKVLTDFFGNGRVDITRAHYDPVTKTLMAHGHQLDQSVMHDKSGRAIALFHEALRPLKDHLLLDDMMYEKVENAFKQQVFSYWWEYPTLDGYIQSCADLFGGKFEDYLSDLGRVFQSDFYSDWLETQKGEAKIVGTIARALSHSPRTLFAGYKLFNWYAEKTLKKRRRAVLKQEMWKGAPEELFQGPVDNLVLAHRHSAEEIEYPEGRFYSLPAPGRLHTEKVENGVVHAHRYYGHLVIQDGVIQPKKFGSRSYHIPKERIKN